jgi:hypothetical protein
MKKPKRDGTKRTLHSRPKLKDNFIVDIKSAPDGWMKEYFEKWDVFMPEGQSRVKSENTNLEL